jgi:transcriptional regulator with XRE-family HTH domain
MSEELDWKTAVRARIAERCVTHEEIEGEAEFGHGYLGKLLTGKKTPTVPTLLRLLGVLGLSLDLRDTPPKNPEQ